MDLEFVKVVDALGDGFDDAVEDGDGEGGDAVGGGDGGFEFAEGVFLLEEIVFDDVYFFAEKFYVIINLYSISL